MGFNSGFKGLNILNTSSVDFVKFKLEYLKNARSTISDSGW